jgi:tight adherence protein B
MNAGRPRTVDDLVGALREVAALSRAGLTGTAVWEPVVGETDAPIPGELAAWAADQDGGELEIYAKAVCAIDHVARVVGGSAGDLLDALGESLEDHQDTLDAREAAIAGPRASARLLQYLPLIGLALGFVMGVNPLGVLFGGGAGTAALAVGVGFFVGGKVWSWALMRSARGRLDAEGLVAIDILGAALAAGLPIPAALAATGEAWQGPVGEAMRTVGGALTGGASWDAAWQRAGQVPPILDGVERALALAWRSGVGATGLLAGLKARALRAERQRSVQASARLGVSLMLPLGLCYLPAFVAVGLVPVMVSIASQLSLGF